MRKKGILFLLFLSLIFIINCQVKTVNAKENFIIYIDPGHGGYDGGAKTDDGVLEKNLNLILSLYLRNYLEGVGIKVYLTRETDEDYVYDGSGTKKKRDLDTRIEMINQSDANLLVSIHMNALPDSRWRGAQTFYDDENLESKVLATIIQQNLTDVLQNTHRLAKEVKTLYLLKNVNIPSAIVEAGFLSNPAEASLLQQPEYQQKVAFAIYLGIIEYLLVTDNVPIY